VNAARIRARRVSPESEKDLEGRLHVQAYDDLSRAEPRLEGESAALVSNGPKRAARHWERKGPWCRG
jgi:hypothetical protein